MKILIIMLSFLVLGVLPAAGSLQTEVNSDLSLFTAILGKWTAKDEDSRFTLLSTTEYLPDGTAVMVSNLVTQEESIIIKVKGTWKISNRKLTMTATETSHPQVLPQGTVTVDEIVSISAKEMILIAEDGTALVRTRTISPPPPNEK